jgi:hypothetical protein
VGLVAMEEIIDDMIYAARANDMDELKTGV